VEVAFELIGFPPRCLRSFPQLTSDATGGEISRRQVIVLRTGGLDGRVTAPFKSTVPAKSRKTDFAFKCRGGES